MFLSTVTLISAPIAEANGLTATPTTTARVAPSSTTTLSGLSIAGATGNVRATLSTDRGTLQITSTSGLTLGYGNNWSGTASITFSGSQSDINAGLASARLTVPAGDATANVSLTAMPDEAAYNYLPSNQHFYEYVSATNITWTNAEAAARGRTYRGQPGYLAAVVSAEINNFLASKIQNADNVWFGLRAHQSAPGNVYNGTAYARVWRVPSGPAAGTVGAVCSNLNGGCTFVDQANYFSSWASGEPNNSGLTENSAVTNWGGSVGNWNDLPNSANGIAGYIVEYGGQQNSDSSLGTGFAGIVTASTAITVAAAASAPAAPVVSGSAGDESISLSWNPPANGGAEITGYEVSIDAGSWTSIATTSSTDTVDGNLVTTVSATVGSLTNGVEYSVRIRAVNEAGSGAASNTVSATPIGLANAPTSVVANGGNASAWVAFVAPADDGGTTITGYTVTASPGGANASCATSPCTVSGLVNGTSYTFTVTATNAVGTGPASTPSNAVTPATTPGAPTGVSATEGDTEAIVSFTAPVSDGGRAITGYTVTAQPGGTQTPCAASPCDVTGLTNGTTYTFTVAAINVVGTGPASTPSNAITPYTTPGAPESVVVTRGDEEVSVSFDAPVSDGGGAITGYSISVQPGDITVPCAASPCEVTGLTNGTSYSVTVVAVNDMGAGAPSSPVSATPATVPDAPTAVDAVRTDAGATVSFVAPAANGDAITGYTVTAQPGGTQTPCAASPCEVTGLTNGTAYTFTVTATNGVGTGPASTPSSDVVPAGVPAAPSDVTASRGNGSATITFTEPNSNGDAVSGYTVTAQPGGTQTPCVASPCDVTGLTNGTAYTFTVTATNGVGTGPASTPSNAVVPATVPGAPTDVSAVRGNAQATVSFTAPASNGAAVSGYTVTVQPGGRTIACSASPCVVDGLTNGTAYTFTVTATNSVGTGTASRPSAAVTPATVADAPMNVVAVAGDRQATISFDAPATNGGSPITGYVVTASCGDTSCPVADVYSTFIQSAEGTDCDSSPCVVEGLVNGTSYTFTVVALNAVGSSVASAATESVVPAGAPSAPMTPTVRQISGGVIVSWAAPLDVNGSPVTGYVVSGGGQTCETDARTTTCTFEGLSLGTVFTVVAQNAAGESAAVTATPEAPTGTLPSTGSDTTGSIVAMALASVVLGAALLMQARRRRDIIAR